MMIIPPDKIQKNTHNWLKKQANELSRSYTTREPRIDESFPPLDKHEKNIVQTILEKTKSTLDYTDDSIQGNFVNLFANTAYIDDLLLDSKEQKKAKLAFKNSKFDEKRINHVLNSLRTIVANIQDIYSTALEDKNPYKKIFRKEIKNLIKLQEKIPVYFQVIEI